MTNLRQRLLAGERLIGTFAAIPHPVAVEVVAASGLDHLCIDWEHSQISRERIEDLLRAAAVHQMPAMVRVPGHGAEAIAAVLDAGANGVLVPRVNTAEQARAIVSATRYPPVGNRGVGPGRAAGYGYKVFDYLARANEEILLAIQVETAEGLANIAGIAAVDGVDMIFIGPGDLSVSIGALGPDGPPKLAAAIATIIETCKAAGRRIGIFRPNGNDVATYAERGVGYFLIGSDTMALDQAMRQTATALKA